jgi:hypothetical protein
MANPSTYPSDGRITSLQNYTANLTGTELLQLVAPGNATAGVNYNVTVTQMLSGVFSVLPSQPANVVLAGPTSGAGTATPAFRALVLADIPGGTSGFPLVGNNATTAPSYQLLTVPGGGIGTAALPAFGVALGNGSSPLSVVVPGTTGYALLANGATTAPSFQLVNLALGTGITPIFNGGTGTSALTLNGVVLGNATALTVASAATGQVLAANAGVPAFTGSPVVATSVTVPLVSSPVGSNLSLNVSSSSAGGLLQVAGANLFEWANSSSTPVFYPSTDNTATLGTSGNRWSNGYFVNLTVSTTATAGKFNATNTAAAYQIGGTTVLSVPTNDLVIQSFFNRNLILNANGTGQGIFCQIAGTNIVELVPTTLFPTTDNTTALGGVNNRWTNGYLVNLTVSTGLSVGTTTNPGAGQTLQTGMETLLSGIPLSSTATAAIIMSSVAGFGIYCGTGVPNVVAGTGSLYLRGDGSTATTRIYVNQNGSTTWTAMTTQA